MPSHYDTSIIDNYVKKRDYVIHFTHIPTGAIVSFPAFLTSFTDTYTSSWDETSVFGRMDQIFTFKQTTRSISFSIDIPCADEEESKRFLVDLRRLSRFLYPTYENDRSATTMTKAPLIRIKFANFISADAEGTGSKGLLGVIKDISIAPVVDAGFFDPGTELYPKTYKLQVPFDVIHERYPGNPIDVPAGTGEAEVQSSDDKKVAVSLDVGEISFNNTSTVSGEVLIDPESEYQFTPTKKKETAAAEAEVLKG